MPTCPLGSQSEGLPILTAFWELLGCCVSCQRCDWHSWQLPTEGDLPVPSFVLSLLLVESMSLSQFSLLNRQNLIWQQWLAAVLTGSGRPQQKLLLVTKKTEGERNGATSLVGVSGYPCGCVKLKSMEETFLYKETQNSSVLGFGTVPFSEVTMQD